MAENAKPRRNLPPEAEKWGREMEVDLSLANEKIARLEQTLGNLARAVAGGIDGMTQIINFDDGDGDSPYYQASGPPELGASAPGSLGMSGVGKVAFGPEAGALAKRDFPDLTVAGNIDVIAIGTGLITSDGGSGAFVSGWGSVGIGAVEVRDAAAVGIGREVFIPQGSNGAVAIGWNVRGGGSGVAIGSGATVFRENDPDGTNVQWAPIAIGNEARASESYAIAIGPYSVADAGHSLAMLGGTIPRGGGGQSIAIGVGAQVRTSASHGIAIGSGTSITSTYGGGTLAVCQGASVSGDAIMAIGPSARASGPLAHAIGMGSRATAQYAVAMGMSANASAYAATAVGAMGPTADAYAATALGGGANANAPHATTVGAMSAATATGAIAIGSGVDAATQEVAAVAARDLEISRSDRSWSTMTPLGGLYGTNPETGLILTDEDGVKWRLNVDTDGVLHVGGYATPTPPLFEWDEIGAGTFSSLASNADGDILFATKTDGIYRSLDGGATWTQESTVTGAQGVRATADGVRGVVCRSSGDYPYRTQNSGDTWATITAAGSRGWTTVDISDDGTKIIGGYGTSYSGTVYISTNSGTSFTPRPLGDTTSLTAPYVAISGDGSTMIVVTILNESSSVRVAFAHKSIDDGVTWEPLGVDFMFDDQYATLRQPHVSTDGQTIVIYSETSAWVSTDGGATFTERTGIAGPVALDDEADNWLAVSPLRLSDDGGATFTNVSPQPNDTVTAATISGDGTLTLINAGGKIWSKP